MCLYRYVYYSQCQHGELYRISYCDRAKTLGLPEKDDRLRHLTSYREANWEPDHHPSRYTPDRIFYTDDLPPPRDRHGSRQSDMSTVGPSEARTALSFSMTPPEPNRDPRASLVPRSVQHDTDVQVQHSHAHLKQYRQHLYEADLLLRPTSQDKIDAEISPTTFSAISMKVTQEDGKVKEIVARFESFCRGAGYDELESDRLRVNTDATRTRASSSSTMTQESDAETVRGLSTLHRKAGSLSEKRSSQFTRENIADLQAFVAAEDSPIDVSMPPHGAIASEGTRVSAVVSGDVQHEDARSPRKPIPTEWVSRPSKVPQLMTAKRAIDRQSKKKTGATSPIDSSTKTLRRTRSTREAFLTKDTVSTIESDLTSPLSPRSPGRFRHSNSTATLRSPTARVAGDSSGQQSSVKATASPSRVSRKLITGTDYRTADHSCGPSSVASSYETANHSPVSPGTRCSEYSFVTANEHHDGHIPTLDPANADDSKQISNGQNTTRAPMVHTRGKSDPPVRRLPAVVGKATLSRPAVPRLSLKIPHGTASTVNKSPSSVGTESPASPSQSSRIPRKAAVPDKAEQEHPTSTIRRAKSLKSMHPAKASKPSYASQAAIETTMGAVRFKERALSHSSLLCEPDETLSTNPVLDPQDVPLPDTPVITSASLARHVRTLNSSGSTPILTRDQEPENTEGAPSNTAPSTQSSSIGNISGTVSTVFTDASQSPQKLDKIALVRSFIEGSVDAMEPESGPIGDYHFNAAVPQSESETSKPSETIVSDMLPKASLADSGRLAHPDVDTESRELSSRVISNATVKGKPFTEDPMSSNSAVVLSRKKFDASEAERVDQATDETSSVLSTSAIHTQPSEVHYNTSPVRGRQPNPAELRPEAEVFVPSRPTLPQEWSQQTSPEQLPQSGFYDSYGIGVAFPNYYQMYPVSVGPGTATDFSDLWRNNGSQPKSPSKSFKKKKKTFAPGFDSRRGQQKMGTSHTSPDKIRHAKDTAGTTENLASTETVSTSREAIPRVAQATESNDASEEMERSPSRELEGAFIMQLDEIDQQFTLRQEKLKGRTPHQLGAIVHRTAPSNEKPCGRASRQLDPSHLSNVPLSQQHQQPYRQQWHLSARPNGPRSGFGHHSLPRLHGRHRGGHRQQYSGGNGLYDQRGHSHIPGPGLPLDCTDPFPNPVPPTGPYRSDIERGFANGYLGYAIGEHEEKKEGTCMYMNIENAVEVVGGPPCNKCDSNQ